MVHLILLQKIISPVRALSREPVRGTDAVPHVQRERGTALHRSRFSQFGAVLFRGTVQV